MESVLSGVDDIFHCVALIIIGLSTSATCRKSLSFGYTSVISFSYGYDSKLPIVLFVGQHFSGSLFEWIHLSILTRERTKAISKTTTKQLQSPP